MEEKNLQIPVTINEENWEYWWEARIFDWCFSSWDTMEEYWKNMTMAISEYADAVNEEFFDFPNTGVLNIKLHKDGRVKDSVLKRFDKNTYKSLSWGKKLKI